MSEDNQGPQRVYGIDLGTTYSCVSYMNDVGIPVIVPNENQSNVTPSVVLFEDDGGILVGDHAKSDMLTAPDNVVERVKDHIGEVDAEGEPWTVRRGGADRRAEEISSLILQKLSTNVAANTPDDGIFSAVITVPAYFDAAQRTATEQAGELAGFSVKGIVNEPVAAALSYSLDNNEDQTVLVYDLGGGTFDTTVINIENRNVKVVCTGGSRSLGGLQWDERIMIYARDVWQSVHGVDEDPLADATSNQEIATQAERAKRRLTTSGTANIMVQHRGNTEQVQLTRDAFDDMTRDLLGQTIDYTEATINIAKEKGVASINKILLVGGSCYMRQVKEAVEEKFGIEAQLHKPDLAVAEGAAIYAGDAQIREAYAEAVKLLGEGAAAGDLDEKAGEFLPPGVDRGRIEIARQVTVTNVSSKNFGTIVLHPDRPGVKQITYLINKNDQVPSDVEKSFSTNHDNQRQVLFSLIESDAGQPPDPEVLEQNQDPDAEFDYFLPGHAHHLDHVKVDLSGDTMRGSPVSLRFQLSEDGGRLEATATDPGTKNTNNVKITNIGALDADQIDQMKEAMQDLKVR